MENKLKRNKCLSFFRTNGFVKISTCDNVKNELKRLSNYQYSQTLKEKGIIEECILLLSVDDADILRDCIIRCACSIPDDIEVNGDVIYIDDYSLIQILANNECTYYEDSIGELLNGILRQRTIYNFFKSYDCVRTINIRELIHLNKDLYKDKNGFTLFKEYSPSICQWYLVIENDKIPFGISVNSNEILQFADNRVNLSESRFAHRINEKFFEEYNKLMKGNQKNE